MILKKGRKQICVDCAKITVVSLTFSKTQMIWAIVKLR